GAGTSLTGSAPRASAASATTRWRTGSGSTPTPPSSTGCRSSVLMSSWTVEAPAPAPVSASLGSPVEAAPVLGWSDEPPGARLLGPADGDPPPPKNAARPGPGSAWSSAGGGGDSHMRKAYAAPPHLQIKKPPGPV